MLLCVINKIDIFFNQIRFNIHFKSHKEFEKNKRSMTDTINNTTNISWSNYIKETIEGCDFSHLAEMDIIVFDFKKFFFL